MVNNVRTVNNLQGDVLLLTNQNLSVSDNGSDTITIVGPDLSGLVTSSELTTELGLLSAEIDSDIVVHATVSDAHHARYTDAEAVFATEAARTSLSGNLQTQIDGKADSVHTHDASDVVTGTFVDGLISQSSVVQHQAEIDHGTISGLGDDDHPHYALVDGSRAFTSTVGGVDPLSTTDLATKNYVDGQILSLRNEMLTMSGSLQTEIDQLRTDLEVCCPLIPAPVVSSFTPTSGMVGTVVTIIGTDFTAATDVTFDMTPATTFVVDSDLQITATVPVGATTGLVQVTTPAGSGSSAAPFTVIPPPSGQLVSIEMEKATEGFLHATEVDVGIGMAGSWSILMWVKSTEETSGQNSLLVDIGPSAFVSDNAIQLSRQSGGPGFVVTTFGSSNSSLFKSRGFDSFFQLGIWVQIVVTWNGTDILVYKDGSVVTPDSQVNFPRTLSSPNARVAFGNRYADIVSPQSLEGNNYMVAMWDVALTSTEISDVYNSGDGPTLDLASNFGNYSSSADLLHWWRLGLDSGDIGKDYGNHTTLIDVMTDAVEIDVTDIVNDFPGM